MVIEELEDITKEPGVSEVKLHGQTHAEEFYRKYGYHTASEIFIEDGIPHVCINEEERRIVYEVSNHTKRPIAI